MSSITINGIVKLAPGEVNLSDARVELWDTSSVYGWLASTTTNKNGEFTAIINEPIAGLISAHTITVGYRVYQSNQRVTVAGVSNVSGIETITITRNVYDEEFDDKSDKLATKYISVYGKVVSSSGIAASEVKVNIYETGFRDKILLATTGVDILGRYKTKIALRSMGNFEVTENRCIHLEVVDDSDSLLVRSNDIYQLFDDQEVNLEIAGTEYEVATEYEVLLGAVNEFIGDADITSIRRNEENNTDEFALIANALGRDVREIENLVNSYVFSNEIDPSAIGNYVHSDFFYALGKLSYSNVNPAKIYSGTKIEAAINMAIENFMIPAHTSGEIEDFIDTAKAWAATAMLSETVAEEEFTIGSVFESIFGNSSDGVNLLKLFHADDYRDITHFWGLYETNYGSTLYTKVQKGLKLIPLTGTQPELIAELIDETSASDNLSALATWEYEAWYDRIDAICTAEDKLCVPHFIRGESTDPENEEAKEAYAEHLRIHFQDYYPLVYLNSKLSGEHGRDLIVDDSVRGKVISFIAGNLNFDLRFASIHEINSEDLDIDEADVDVVKEALEPFQRLLRVTKGKPEAMVQMMLDGLDSATAVVDVNEDEFVATYAAKFGGTSNAQFAYQTANTQFAAAQNFSLSLQGNIASTTVLASSTVPVGSSWSTGVFPLYTPAVDPSEDPTWTKMFGNLDYCCCDHCMSLYSPGAYLTDILRFLKVNCAAGYNELVRRRQDLIHIDLTCKNTNTPVPYIDLVNELLEKIMAGNSANHPNSYQTNGTAKALAAHPEHYYKDGSGNYQDIVNNNTYYTAYRTIYDNTLANAVYPMFNFNYALEETRTYLKHLGTSRYEIMKLFQFYHQTAIAHQTIPQIDEITDYSVAMEYLGLSRQDGYIISGSHGNNTSIWKFYGIPSSNNTSTPVVDPVDPTQLLTGNWYQILYDRIDHLLHFARISYSELLQFLSTDFLNPIGGTGQRIISITARDGFSPDTCNLSGLKLKFPFASGSTTNYDLDVVKKFFDRLHKYIRLYRKKDLTIYDWDVLFRQLKALNSSSIEEVLTTLGFNNFALMRISEVFRLADTLNLPVLELAAWAGSLDTTIYNDHDCSGLKEKPSVYDRIFRDKAVFNPPLDLFGPLGVLPANESYIDNASAIASVCNVSEDDLILLLNFVKVVDPSNSNAVVLAIDAGEMTLQGLSRLYILANIQRALKVSTRELLTVFTFMEIDFIQNPTWSLLDSLLQNINQINRSPFSVNEINYIIRNVDELDIIAPDNATIQVFYEALRSELKKFARYAGSTGPLVGQELDNVQSLINTVYQHYSKQFNVTSTWVQTIFGSQVDLPNPPGGFTGSLIHQYFVNPDIPITEGSFVNEYQQYRMFHKVSTITKALKLKIHDFNNLFPAPNNTYIDFDFSNLPIGTPNVQIPPLPDEYAGFLRLMKWIEVRDRLNLTEYSWWTLIWSAAQTTTLQIFHDIWSSTLKTSSGWGTIVDELLGTTASVEDGLLQVLYPDDFVPSTMEGASIILKVLDIISLSARIGLNPVTLRKISFDDLVLADSNKILQAAKGKHDEDAWLKIAKPLHDPLRENKRQGLVDHVLSYKQDPTNYRVWRNENDLYAYLLIDVEMSPCMMTSRIKQAISSVQLFVDRVHMSLEYTASTSSTAIVMQPPHIKQWREWRKWYRVWEANRKVFLYPENWIEPELRDDKTLFFRELETKLAQDEITDRHVEDALREYLQKLDEVARLEPIGFFNEWHPVLQKKIVHAFAKSGEAPQYIYYRRLFDNEWSGWERVDIEVNSTHVAPVVYNNRLFLFWLTFREKKNAIDGNVTSSNEWLYNPGGYHIAGGQNANYQNSLEISLNWSEYKDGSWQKQRISKEKIQFNLDPGAESWLQTELGSAAHIGVGPARVRGYFNFLTEDRKLGFIDFIKSRIFLSADLPNQWNGDIFKMCILFQSDQVLHKDFDRLNLVQAFRFKGGIYSEPVVTVEWDTLNLSTPLYTVYKDQKFYENTRTYEDANVTPPKQPLVNESIIMDNQSHFWYAYNGNTNNPFLWLPQSPVTILGNQNDNGLFRLIKRADPGWTLEDNLFFYDDKHTFYARKVPAAAHFDPVVVQSQVNLNLNPNVSLPPIAVPPTFPGPPVVIGSTLPGQGTPPAPITEKFFFQTFYHPHVPAFVTALNTKGIDGLLNIDIQKQTDTMNFNGAYQPTVQVHPTHPTDKVEFEFWGAYSVYNWELFFHTPMLLAQRLMDNQKFDEAQKWFHYVFNPTSNTGLNGATDLTKKRFWKFRIFYDQAGMNIQTLNDLLILIHWNNSNAVAQVQKWEANPFKPHVIARMRILAYMKYVVMKYLDNLIAWADQLFARDTMESINEATNLYILAENILGQRPREVPKRAYTSPKSFSQLLAAGLDSFSNATVAIESYISPNTGPLTIPGPHGTSKGTKMFYFCLSPNEKLLGYWDTIADRLYKIRNCRNISGQVRSLPLFEPPIDPSMLVRAAAAGLDINSVLNDVSNANLPNYRFSFMLQKANEICNDVKGLGGSLLAALEKKDAEQLALIRSTQELNVLESVRLMKLSLINEAKANLNALKKTREVIDVRHNYYATRQKVSGTENEYFASLRKTLGIQKAQANLQAAASLVSLIPQFHLQATFAIGASFGGQQIATMLNAISQKMGVKAAESSYEGTVANTKAGYERRWDDWQFQVQSAKKELEQIDKQIIAGEIRIGVAEKDLESHEIQIENNKATDEYMRSKYTNVELYNWMITQISTTYFQAYRLAYEVAKKAGKCYNFELPMAQTKSEEIIQFGYWDSLKKGLMCGEKLQNDLRKLEQAYLDENKRTLELTKHVSLASLSPDLLQELKQKGSTMIFIPEEYYDLDYPGHYNRRIKSVSISIPCVAGPYTTVPCTLSLGLNKIRVEPKNNATYLVGGANVNTSFVATSSAQNDSGMFEFNFRDERYLPFEGGGAVSQWSLTLGGVDDGTVRLRPFDFDTISDVILHIKYTALDGVSSMDGSLTFGERRTDAVISSLQGGEIGDVTPAIPLPLLFSLKHEFSTEWFAGLNTLVDNNTIPTPENVSREFTVPINIDMFPHFCKERGVELTSVHLYALPNDTVSSYFAEMPGEDASLNSGGGPVPFYGTMPLSSMTVDVDNSEDLVFKIYKIDGTSSAHVPMEDADMANFYIIIQYNVL